MKRGIPLGLVVALAGCLDLGVRPGLEIRCADDADCLDGQFCSPVTARCLAAGELAVPALGLAASPSRAGVALSWSPPEGGAEIVVERADPGAAFAEIAAQPAGTVAYLDEGAPRDAEVDYRVRLRAGEELFEPHPDDTARALTFPGRVDGLGAVASPGSIELSWLDAQLNTTGYRVERVDPASEERVVLAESQAEPLFIDNTVAGDVAYSYEVQALNPSGASEPVVVSQRALPDAPAPLEISLVDFETVRLSWVDTSARETGYLVERLRDGALEASFVAPADSDTATDTGLAPDVDYTWRVRAETAIGASAPAEVVARSAALPELQLTGVALDESCALTVSGGVVVDARTTLADTGGDIETIDRADLTVDENGLVGPLTDLRFDDYAVEWTAVDALDGATTVTSTVALTRTDETDPLTPLTRVALAGEGRQVWDPALEDGVTFDPGVCGACAGETTQLTGGSARCVIHGPERSLACWGTGDALSGRVLAPARICADVACAAPLVDVRAVGSATNRICAVVGPERRAFCWGRQGFGQLGNGRTDLTTPVSEPRPVCASSGTSPACDGVFLDEVRSVDGAPSLAGNHACAVMEDGTARCWGRNRNGQLGSGDTADSGYPVTVLDETGVSPLAGVAAISVGSENTCAHLETGEVRCWGASFADGRDDTAGNTLLPVVVQGVGSEPALTGVVALSAGERSACAVRDSGAVVCWGTSQLARLGNGSDTGAQPRPGPVCETGAVALANCAPLTGAVDVAVSAEGACALLESGQVRCWGRNNFGQVGASFEGTVELNPVRVCDVDDARVDCDPLEEIVTIAASPSTFCAVDRRGNTNCWGTDPLGDGGAQNARSPFPRRVCDLEENGGCASGSMRTPLRSCFSFDAELSP